MITRFAIFYCQAFISLSIAVNFRVQLLAETGLFFEAGGL